MANLRSRPPIRAGFLCSLILALSLSAGCASELEYEVASVRQNPVPKREIQALTGLVLRSDGDVLDLTAVSDRPVVLIFSQDTCQVCTKEARLLRDSLRSLDTNPSTVTLITVLVGALKEDAEEWKVEHRIPWYVGFDRKSEIFSRYCEKSVVPCNVVFVPRQGIVWSHNDLVLLDELEKWTGEIR